MTILQTIKGLQLEARKARDKSLLSIYSTLFAEVEKVGKDKANRETTDEEAIAVIKKFIANAAECQDATRDHGVATLLHEEMELYKKLLPAQLSAADMVQIIIKQNLKNLPDIMKYFKATYPGQYDGKLLSMVAKEATMPTNNA